MDFGTNSRKRILSAAESISSPSRKKARVWPVKLSKLDCTVAPQRPEPQPIVAQMPFSIDASTTFTSSAHSGHTSARFYQHQSSNQVYDRHQTYNYQPQSYVRPPSRSPAAPYWPGFSGYQPAWTPTRHEPYGCYSFADMCQTSVSCSIYSGFSDGSEHVSNLPSTTRTSGPVESPNPSRDTRGAFVDALVSCLSRVKETLVAQQSSIDEMLQLAALLRNQQ